MTVIRDVFLPLGPNGEKDPNDYRGDPGVLNRATMKHNGKDLSPFAWANEFTISDAEMEQIADPCWAYPNLIVQGHLMVLCAKPNGGKTTIMMHAAQYMAAQGYNVIYINADVAGTDAKAMHAYAKKSGFTMIFPDMKQGKTARDIVSSLNDMSQSDGSLEGYVIIIDTLKKMTDLMDKKDQKSFYGLMRKLTARGLTSALNSHTNKHNSADGSPIYEGTNETHSEPDELIYLVSTTDPATGDMLVSTLPEKKRCTIEPITFRIGPDRTVTQIDGFVDVLTIEQQRAQHEEDLDRISLVCDALKNGPKNQSELVDILRGHGVNHKTARRILRAYGAGDSFRRYWDTRRTFGNNGIQYSLPR